MNQIELNQQSRDLLERVRHKSKVLSLYDMPSDLAEAAVWEIGRTPLERMRLPLVEQNAYRWYLRELSKLLRTRTGWDLALELEICLRKWVGYRLDPELLQSLLYKCYDHIAEMTPDQIKIKVEVEVEAKPGAGMARRIPKYPPHRRSGKIVREVVAAVVPAEDRERYMPFARELCATLGHSRKLGAVPGRGHVHGATRGTRRGCVPGDCSSWRRTVHTFPFSVRARSAEAGGNPLPVPARALERSGIWGKEGYLPYYQHQSRPGRAFHLPDCGLSRALGGSSRAGRPARTSSSRVAARRSHSSTLRPSRIRFASTSCRTLCSQSIQSRPSVFIHHHLFGCSDAHQRVAFAQVDGVQPSRGPFVGKMFEVQRHNNLGSTDGSVGRVTRLESL